VSSIVQQSSRCGSDEPPLLLILNVCVCVCLRNMKIKGRGGVSNAKLDFSSAHSYKQKYAINGGHHASESQSQGD
jgi:hypothetical protein